MTLLVNNEVIKLDGILWMVETFNYVSAMSKHISGISILFLSAYLQTYSQMTPELQQKHKAY